MFRSGFSEKKIDLTEHKKQAICLFKKLYCSSMLAAESNWILDAGSKLLERMSNPTQEQFDQIVVGALLFALVRNDLKYKHANYNQFCIEKTYDDTLLALRSRTSDEHEAIIQYIGKKVLIDKEIYFRGEFSRHSPIEASIKSGLPFINNDYFASYGVSPVDEKVKLASSSLSKRI